MEEKKIFWLKWQDPMGHLVYEKKEEGEENIEFVASKDSFNDPDKPAYSPSSNSQGNTGPAIVGPQGVIPIHEHNLPGKIYNFWNGHTNFGITGRVAFLIEKVVGVETLDIFTRYRFRIGIGKAFEQRKVMRAIEEAIIKSEPKPTTNQKMKEILNAKKKAPADIKR